MEKTLKAILKDNLIWICLLTFLIMVAGEIITELIGSLSANLSLPFFDSNFKYMFNMYFQFWGIWFAFIVFLLISKKNRYILDTIKANKSGNTIKMLLIGFLFGFLLNGLCGLVAFLNKDFQLSFYKFEPFKLALLFGAVFIQSSAEELVCRGFLYERVKNRYKSAAFAVFVNSLFFAAIHLGNEGISVLGLLDLFITGIFFSLMVYYFNSLWMAMASHTTWNFTQNILLGLPNSGASSKYSVFVMKEGLSKNSFAFDTVFGLEGTILAVTVMVFGCLVLYLFSKKLNRDRLQ